MYNPDFLYYIFSFILAGIYFVSSIGYGTLVWEKIFKYYNLSFKIPIYFITGSFLRDICIFLSGTIFINKISVCLFFLIGLFFFRTKFISELKKYFIKNEFIYLFITFLIILISVIISIFPPVFFDFQSYHFYLPMHFLNLKKISMLDHITHSLFFSYFHSGYLFFAAFGNYNSPLVLQIIICTLIVITGAEFMNKNIFISFTTLLLTPFFFINIYTGNTDLITGLITCVSYSILLKDELLSNIEMLCASFALLFIALFIKPINAFFLISAMIYLFLFKIQLLKKNFKTILILFLAFIFCF